MPSQLKRIDAHTHFSSLKFLDFVEKKEGKPFHFGGMYRRKPSIRDPKARLELLDRNEIDMHVLVPVPWLEAFPLISGDRTLAAEAARLLNDEIAAAVAAYPTRFRGVAVLPTVDPEAMVAELHRAVRELGFLGACVAVGPTVKRMDHPDFEPLFAALVELDATLWMHPSRPPIPDYTDEKTSPFQEWQTIGWPLDTTSAMQRIVFSGVFERYPDIRIVTHHHGGMIPYYAARMQGGWAAFEESGMTMPTKISKPYIYHFRKFYCDTACNEFAPKVLELALDFFEEGRMLFGSDTPFGISDGQHYITGVLSSIEAMRVSDEVRAGILAGNAMQALKIPGKA